MRAPPKSAYAGQALVEMVLGTLIFVTVFIFGIHFAELGFFSLKTLEAANFATFNATGRLMHDASGGATPSAYANYTASVTAAATEAQSRYADFDGRSSVVKAAPSLTQVFTRVVPQAGNLLDVTCGAGGVPGTELGLSAAAPTPSGVVLGRVFPADGNTAIRCKASSVMEGFNIPVGFSQSGAGGFFAVPHFTPLQIRVCAVGRASGNTCPGELALTLDDWGWSGPLAAKACPVSNACPSTYFAAAKRIYQSSPIATATEGTKLVQLVNGSFSPAYGEQAFWMSFVGKEGKNGRGLPYLDTLPGGEAQLFPDWWTTPFMTGDESYQKFPTLYKDAYDTRQQTYCFLGNPCP